MQLFTHLITELLDRLRCRIQQKRPSAVPPGFVIEIRAAKRFATKRDRQPRGFGSVSIDEETKQGLDELDGAGRDGRKLAKPGDAQFQFPSEQAGVAKRPTAQPGELYPAVNHEPIRIMVAPLRGLVAGKLVTIDGQAEATKRRGP